MLIKSAQIVLAHLVACTNLDGMTETELRAAATLSPVGFEAGLDELEDRHLIEGYWKGDHLYYRITDSGRQAAAELTG